MCSLLQRKATDLLKQLSRSKLIPLKLNKSVYLVDEVDENHLKNREINNVNKFTSRTHTCGELNRSHVGQKVTLCGWLEFQRMQKFLVLRDSYGHTQLIIDEPLTPQTQQFKDVVDNLNYESTLEIHGIVRARPLEMINKKQSTGEIEVAIKHLHILNPSAVLPFNIRSYQKAQEALRMKYRYLDLRFSSMQKILRLRSEFAFKLREYLTRYCGFVDVETPTLFKATPGGAQEFVVPTRHAKKFFSLTQSPQQFKQMLMCGGVDRYFQIARCYRDETTRPDRQPEFTQLDIEMSFTNVDGVIQLVEDLLQFAWPNDLHSIPQRFTRLSYNDAMKLYGTDRPDTRYEHTIIDCSKLLPSLQNNDRETYIGCIFFENEKADVKLSSESLENAKQTRLLRIKANNRDSLEQKLTKIVNNRENVRNFMRECNIQDKVSIFIAIGDRNEALRTLGRIRKECAEHLQQKGIQMYDMNTFNFLWIVDFPLFSVDDCGVLQSEHHPFTMPHADDVELIDSDCLLKTRSLSYDLVLNGEEVGGGSIRIHQAALQAKIFEKLRITGLEHMLEMLSYGCPPHGGIALGLDRLLACMCQTSSIRDVIAFPKTAEGKDPISGAPSELSEDARKLYDL